MPRAMDRVLIACFVAALRTTEGWFTPAAVQAVFDDLRVPRPGGVNTVLCRLADGGQLVRSTVRRQWSMTPEGREAVRAIIGQVDLTAVEAEIATGPVAELSQTPHLVIPPEFAPPRWQPAISRLLDQYPFESNVFCMTRFPNDEKEGDLPDPVKQVIEVGRAVLAEHGLILHLASDRNADDELFGNIAAHMWASRYGVGLFETRFGEELNDNVQIEVGGMLITGRRCALLKDRYTPNLPTDLTGHIYKRVDFEDLDAVATTLRTWVTEDLAL